MKTMLALALLAASPCPHYPAHNTVIVVREWYEGKPAVVDTLKQIVITRTRRQIVRTATDTLVVDKHFTRCDSCGEELLMDSTAINWREFFNVREAKQGGRK